MRRFCTGWGCPWGGRIPPAVMAVLKARYVGRILVGTADDSEITVGRRSTSYDHALLVASRYPELPMLPDRDISYYRLEFIQRRELLADVEPRVHLRHGAEGRPQVRLGRKGYHKGAGVNSISKTGYYEI